MAPRNRDLLKFREDLQVKIDQWHRENQSQSINLDEYKGFLKDIGYLKPEGEDFAATTANVDDEVARVAGPQLVVPISNARFALNAANARWGSLYDAVYGSDIIPEEGGADKGPGYNPVRGEKVIAYARGVLDESAPLAQGTHSDSVLYRVDGGKLVVKLKDGSETGLKDPAQFVGYKGSKSEPESVLLVRNGMHLEIQVDASHPIGQDDPAHVKDVAT